MIRTGASTGVLGSGHCPSSGAQLRCWHIFVRHPKWLIDQFTWFEIWPIFHEMLMRRFVDKTSTSRKKRREVNFRKSAKFWNWRSREEKRIQKTVKFVDLVKRFPRSISWLSFSSFGFDTYGSRRHRERVVQILRTKNECPLDEKSSTGDEYSPSQHRCPER